MSEVVQITPGGSHAKVRNPWLGLLWTLLTVGLYAIFWWYFVNRELRDLGQARGRDLGRSPATSVLAVTVGSLVVVPPLVSFWRTGGRIAGGQELVGIRPSGTRPLFFGLTLFTGVFGVVYGQYQLNDIWRALAAGGAGHPDARATPEASTPGWSAPEASDAFGRAGR